MNSFLPTVRFVGRFVVLGLAAAFIIVWLRPQLLPAMSSHPQAAVTQQGEQAPAANHQGSTFSYADAVNLTAPAVVSIYTNTMVMNELPGVTDPLFKRFLQHNLPKRQRRGLGSGVIVRSDGYILTSNHVIDHVDDIRLALPDGRVFQPEIIGTDQDTDLAVLRIAAENLPVAALVGPQELQVGDVVLAIGNAYGLNNTVTMGIVSAKGRNDLNLSALEDFIQTDAAINAGNSGGALINAHGEVVGINSSMLDQSTGAQGIGFAIPIAIASKVLDQIVTYGSVRRGWIGASFSDNHWINRREQTATSLSGARVEQVLTRGPAWSIGLQPGDVVLSWNGQTVENSNQLNLMIANTAPMDNVEVNIERGGIVFTTSLQVMQQPAPDQISMNSQVQSHPPYPGSS
ncbi:MAG: trypsin-like peptidase domain-containing protein [Gammaproteobacteria bacterium]|jgi:S1-C subfamily serine protease|nr:trypsin-like peptidase domain-containing protein [Gammaproteobacteria bacterium]